MAKLTANVVLRDPQTGEPEVLFAGADLPDWAEGMVGDHVLKQDDEKPRQTRNSSK